MGKTIEPAIKPLGYDWKIGIAVVSSFAAREVFVGTLATIYSVGNQSEEEATIKMKMAEDIDAKGNKIFNFATGISLLLFYAFAMQCVSTLAIVKKDKLLEMAYYSTGFYERICLFGCTNYLSKLEIVFENTDLRN